MQLSRVVYTLSTRIRELLIVISSVPIHPYMNIGFFVPRLTTNVILFCAFSIYLYSLNSDLVITTYRIYFLFLLFSLNAFGVSLDKQSNAIILYFLLLNIISWPMYFLSIDVFAKIRPLNTLSGYHGVFREPSFFAEFLIFTLTVLRNKRFIRGVIIFALAYAIHVKSGTLAAFAVLVTLCYFVLLFRMERLIKTTSFLLILLIFNIIIYELSVYEFSWRHPSNVYALTKSIVMVPDYQYSELINNGAEFFGQIGFGNFFPGIFSLVPIFIASFGVSAAIFSIFFITRTVHKLLGKGRALPRHQLAIVLAGFFWGLFFAPKWFPFAAILGIYFANTKRT